MEAMPLVCKRVNVEGMALDKVVLFTQRMMEKQIQKGSRDHVRQDQGRGRWNQALIGKLAEVAAGRLLGCDVDFRIWSTGTRGKDQFEPDLFCTRSSMRFHVKCCTFSHAVFRKGTVYPTAKASWTMDSYDPLVSRPRSEDVIVFMFARQDGVCACLGWVYAEHVKKLWRPCVSKHMKHKLALYIEEIVPHIQPIHVMQKIVLTRTMTTEA